MSEEQTTSGQEIAPKDLGPQEVVAVENASMVEAGSAALPTPYANCDNCGNALIGPYCWHCGQPTRNLIRFFPALVGETLEGLLDVDSRLHRTLVPLMTRPGRLTIDYIEGRRARYVPPLRLYLFTSIVFFLFLAFFTNVDVIDDDMSASERVEMAQAIEDANAELDRLEATADGTESDADLARRVRAREVLDSLEQQLEQLEAETPQVDEGSGAADEVVPGDIGQARILEDRAQDRLEDNSEERAEGQAQSNTGPEDGDVAPASTAQALPSGTDAPVEAVAEATTPETAIQDDEDPEGFNISIGEDDWDPSTEPVNVSWFPDWLNEALTEEAIEFVAKADRIGDNPQLMVDEFFNVLPQVMFVLLPLFALILKLMYVFKKRYYMEHLILALYSHSFIFLSMLLMLFIDELGEWIGGRWASAADVADIASGVIAIVLWVWIPIYLFIAQKRMYRQGWWMTSLKFLVTGVLYLALILVGTTVSAVLGVVMMA